MSDFCYSWPVLNRIFHQVELMDRMMGLVGVDPAVAGRVDKGAAWYEARTNCISCCHERECRNWLECSEGFPLPPDFCPNVEFFQQCAETAPAAPRVCIDVHLGDLGCGEGGRLLSLWPRHMQ